MGVKRGKYQTQKQKLQNECDERGIKYAARWGTKELKAALDGERVYRTKSTMSQEKRRLQEKLTRLSIPYSKDWTVTKLKEALAGAPAPKRKTAPKICLPVACTCGRPIDPEEALKNEQRRDPRMHQQTGTHHFDGVIFCRHTCECSQTLVVKVPVRARALKCECGRSAVMWDKDGKGTCAHCANK